MRRFLFALMLLIPATVQAQSPPPPVVTANQFFGFDYKPTDMVGFAIVRFELQVDGQPRLDIGIPPKFTLPDTLPGFETYKTPIPALVPADHDAVVFACNAQMCGDPSPTFRFTLAVKPPAVQNVRTK